MKFFIGIFKKNQIRNLILKGKGPFHSDQNKFACSSFLKRQLNYRGVIYEVFSLFQNRSNCFCIFRLIQLEIM